MFRQILIDGTIRVISREGMDKASAKQIEQETGVNAVYIYRCFRDKDDLFAKTFAYLDDELSDKILQNLPIMYDTQFAYVQRCRIFYYALWKFLLGNRDKCMAFVRYFYSPYFMRYSAQEHKARFAKVMEKIGPAFKEEADVWMILNHILNVMLDFAVKVHNGQMLDNDDYSEHVFRVVYASVKQYFINSEGSDFSE